MAVLLVMGGAVMSNDWAPGDLALCVKGGDLNPGIGYQPVGGFPQKAKIYRVADVKRDHYFVSGHHLALILQDGPQNKPGRPIWNASRFIKVTPRAADEFDRETIALMTGERIPVGRNV